MNGRSQTCLHVHTYANLDLLHWLVKDIYHKNGPMADIAGKHKSLSHLYSHTHALQNCNTCFTWPVSCTANSLKTVNKHPLSSQRKTTQTLFFKETGICHQTVHGRSLKGLKWCVKTVISARLEIENNSHPLSLRRVSLILRLRYVSSFFLYPSWGLKRRDGLLQWLTIALVSLVIKRVNHPRPQ